MLTDNDAQNADQCGFVQRGIEQCTHHQPVEQPHHQFDLGSDVNAGATCVRRDHNLLQSLAHAGIDLTHDGGDRWISIGLGQNLYVQLSAADALSLRVYRRLEDGLPATLETQLQFNVTGSAREQ